MKYKHALCANGTSDSGDLAYFRQKKDLSFDDLTGPVK